MFSLGAFRLLQEVAQLADADGRSALIFLAPAVAIGWVLYNIAGPAQNQLKAQADAQSRLRSAIGDGMVAASFFAAKSAEAAQVRGCFGKGSALGKREESVLPA